MEKCNSTEKIANEQKREFQREKMYKGTTKLTEIENKK